MSKDLTNSAVDRQNILNNPYALADAVADLGKPEDIGRVFSGFQRYLYQPAA